MNTNEVRQSIPNIPYIFHDDQLLLDAKRLAADLSPLELAHRLQTSLAHEISSQANTINLIASESVTSLSVRSLLAHPIGGRMGGGQIGKQNRLFPACQNIDEIESLCYSVYTQLFGAKFCEYRLLSNMNAIALVYFGLMDSTKKVFSISLPNGGDTSNSPLGPPGLKELEIFSIPYDGEKQDIIWDEFEPQAKKLRPEIVAISKTSCLFPLNLEKIKNIIQDWDGKLFLDAAHEFGLIAGGIFCNPFNEGVDILSGSVGKSFSGPQSGMLLWNDNSYTPHILRYTFPTLVSSYQINRVAAITLAALEMKAYGSIFMQQAVSNAKALAQRLSDRGVPVLFAERGFTSTHQIILDVEHFGSGRVAAHLLAEAGILGNQIIIYKDQDSRLFDPTGLRLGTIIVTRQGMMESEMSFIGDCIADALLKCIDISILKKEVEMFMKSYQSIFYCFENEFPTKN